ncbi:FKBP-like peptidyl-prolyl cis-trans isomerase family protein isoform X3 [Wolffia australiana]
MASSPAVAISAGGAPPQRRRSRPETTAALPTSVARRDALLLCAAPLLALKLAPPAAARERRSRKVIPSEDYLTGRQSPRSPSRRIEVLRSSPRQWCRRRGRRHRPGALRLRLPRRDRGVQPRIEAARRESDHRAAIRVHGRSHAREGAEARFRRQSQRPLLRSSSSEASCRHVQDHRRDESWREENGDRHPRSWLRTKRDERNSAGGHI